MNIEFNPFGKNSKIERLKGNEFSPVVIEAKIGDHIDEFVEKLIKASKNRYVIGHFGMTQRKEDEVEFRISKGSDVTPDGLKYFYYEKLAERTKKYINSSEYAEKDKIKRQESQKDQEQINKLIKELPNLNFNDPQVVLEWIGNFEKFANDGTSFYRDDVIDTFLKHDYSSMYNDLDIEKFSNDRDKTNKIIVSKALHDIRIHGSIHPRVQGLIKKWKEKFSNK